MKRIFIDIKTTGTNPLKHGIHQISGQVYVDDRKVDEFDLRPRLFHTDKCAPEALRLMEDTGINLVDVMNRPMLPRDAHDALESVLSNHIDRYDSSDKATMIGYNCKFDWDFLVKFFEKCGNRYFGSWFYFPPIDVAIMASLVLGEDRKLVKNFKLHSICEHFGITSTASNYHSADFDIDMTKKLYYHLMELLSPDRK